MIQASCVCMCVCTCFSNCPLHTNHLEMPPAQTAEPTPHWVWLTGSGADLRFYTSKFPGGADTGVITLCVLKMYPNGNISGFLHITFHLFSCFRARYLRFKQYHYFHLLYTVFHLWIDNSISRLPSIKVISKQCYNDVVHRALQYLSGLVSNE